MVVTLNGGARHRRCLFLWQRRLLCDRSVGEGHHAQCQSLGIHKLQSFRAHSIFEEGFSTAHDYGMNKEPKLIYEIGFYQRWYQGGTANDLNFLPGLLYQLVYFFDDILLDDC
jgi:hypothetical protein